MFKSFTAAAVAISFASAAGATITTYTSASAYAAAVTSAHLVTFEGLPAGRRYTPITEDGVVVSPTGIDLYIVTPGIALTQNPVTLPTTSLSADGDEDFDFRLASGGAFDGIALDYATNRFGPPVLSLYSVTGVLIGSVSVAIAPDSLGFFGVRSSVPIGYARSVIDRGYTEDTAVDNIRIGFAVPSAGVPEPAAWALMLFGFGLAGVSLRQRRGAATLAA